MTQRRATIPVNHEVLVWARRYSGLTLTQAANALGIDENALISIEAGRVEITNEMLRKLSQVYRQPESVLLLPSPPELQPLPSDYRTVGGRPANPSPETVWAIREVQTIQSYVSELIESDPELLAHANISHATISDDVEQVAILERERFGIPVSEQKKGGATGAFRRWRARMQSLGILVFIKRMPWVDCRGFSLPGDGLVPTIVVNSEDTDPAKSFTLFHEYGHFILGDAGVCVRAHDSSPKGRVERWCNDFAAAFLAPQSDLLDYLERRRFDISEQRDWSVIELRRVANYFCVSRQAMALRAQKLGYVPPDYYDRNRSVLESYDQRPKREIERPIKIPRHPGWRSKEKLEEVGIGAATVILSGWQSGAADATEAADALGLNLNDLFNLEEYAEVERIQHAGV